MTTSDTPSQGIGLAEAANQFGALLSGETGKQTPKQASEDNAPADNAEALEATASTDETPDADEAPLPPNEDGEDTLDEGSEDADAAADEEGEADEAPDPMDALHTVKIDGKVEQVPLKELVNGYQRQADYTRKTMALQAERQTVHQQYAEVQQERAQYGELLNALAGQLSQQVANEPDWDALYAENPLEYVRQKDLHRESQEQLAAAQSEQQRLNYLQTQEEVARLTNQVQDARAKLHDAFPAWKDEKRWKADRVKIREYGLKAGYSERELDRAYDNRAVALLYKSMRYDELRAQRPQAQRKQAPVLSRPSAPQSTPMRKASEVTRDKQRLSQTGRVSDAAKLFERLI